MPKTTQTYWNVLRNNTLWEYVPDTNELIEFCTMSIDENTKEYTRLTRFKPGANTETIGCTEHDYPEEVFIVSGKLYDKAFDQWLEQGDYASRPPHEKHGPFYTDVGCVVLEVSFPLRK